MQGVHGERGCKKVQWNARGCKGVMYEYASNMIQYQAHHMSYLPNCRTVPCLYGYRSLQLDK